MKVLCKHVSGVVYSGLKSKDDSWISGLNRLKTLNYTSNTAKDLQSGVKAVPNSCFFTFYRKPLGHSIRLWPTVLIVTKRFNVFDCNLQGFSLKCCHLKKLRYQRYHRLLNIATWWSFLRAFSKFSKCSEILVRLAQWGANIFHLYLLHRLLFALYKTALSIGLWQAWALHNSRQSFRGLHQKFDNILINWASKMPTFFSEFHFEPHPV